MQCNNTPNLDQHIIEAMMQFRPIKIPEQKFLELSNLEDYPYVTGNGAIYKAEAKKDRDDCYTYFLLPISTYLRVIKKLIFIDQQQVDIVIEYYDGYSIRELSIDRETVLSKFGIKKLLAYGIGFNENHSDKLLDYLLFSDRKAEIEHVHSHTGWFTVEGNVVFRSYRLLGREGTLPFSSNYAGNLNLTPHGSLDTWVDLIKKDVLPYTPLTFCMLLGMAAPVLSRLYQKFDLGSLIFALSNSSSTGKSTAAELAASAFSCPTHSGTFHNFLATQSYLWRSLAEESGLTVILDEGASYTGDFNLLFYTISSGTDKGRLRKDTSIRESVRWNNIVITTSEFVPISDNAPNGIRTRCFCLTDSFTKDAAHADRIKTTISENYGWAGNTFVQWLLNTQDVNIEKDYLECTNILMRNLKESGRKSGPFTSRAFSRLAVILQTADYVSQCFNLDIKTDNLIEYVIKIERGVQNEADQTQKALDDILADVSCTSSHYISESNINPQNVTGKIVQEGDYKKIILLKTEFNRICKKIGVQPKSILKKFRERGILDAENDRLSKRIRLQKGFPEQVCYVIKIEDAETVPQNDAEINF